MKSFELSKKVSKNGRRHFKVILNEIYPDSCVDESNGVGTVYNKNGITWIREYCENALPSIQGMSLKCEFLDPERTLLNGHGETEIKDGLPIFEDAVVVCTFENGYITDIETDEGVKTVCVGEGTIDGLCYHNFCEKLEKDIEDGNAPNGSVEILKTDGNPSIVYKYGYKDYGRIPMVFEFSGFSLLGVEPADQTAKILELNNNVNEEENTMGENEIKAIVSQVIGEMNSSAEEINKMREECEQRIAESQALVTELQNEINGLNQNIAELESKVNALNEANTALTSEKEALSVEVNELRTNLEDAQKKEKIGELNEAIKEFTDEQRAYAQTEIDTFNMNPLTCEINSVVDKIHAEIGKRYMEEAKKASEHEDNEVEDIFSEINEKKITDEDVDIF